MASRIILVLISCGLSLFGHTQSLFAYNFQKDSIIDASQRPSSSYSYNKLVHAVIQPCTLFLINSKEHTTQSIIALTRNKDAIKQLKIINNKSEIAQYTTNESIDKVVLLTVRKKQLRKMAKNKLH